MKNDKLNWGITLSGGGARGIAHLGVLHALDERDLRPQIISGTSFGSIVGAMYAGGLKPKEILEAVEDFQLFRQLRPAFSSKGLLKFDKVREALEELLPVQTFEELDIPFVAATTNLQMGHTVYFQSGDLVTPVLASSCVPILFLPIEIDGEGYVDGGLLNNLPAEAIRDKVKYLVGVHSNPLNVDVHPENLRELMERTFQVTINNNSQESMELCNIVVQPQRCSEFRVFDFKKAKELFEVGYEGTQPHLQAIEDAVT